MWDKRQQCTSSVLMIRPKHFGYNEATATSNFFQKNITVKNLNKAAQKEFDATVELLRSKSIEVFVFDDLFEIATPDSIFPNNWISLLHSNMACVFSMEAENRRLEKRLDIIDSLKEFFQIDSIDDYSLYERENKFLEGTGSMVIDHANAIVYAALSSRTNIELVNLFCSRHHYNPIVFSAFDLNNLPVYHTNVVMCVGENFCVLCKDAIRDKGDCENVLKRLAESGKEIIEISLQEMHSFAGNMLQVKNKFNEHMILCSKQAFDLLDKRQIEKLKLLGEVVPIDLSTIETIGGGSIRCTIAEIFCAPKTTIV